MKHEPVKLAIVGGGAAGMFAAAVAAERGVGAVLIERKARLGSKVLMTANGRCNFTKDLSSEQFLEDVGPCRDFVAEAIRECGPRKIIAGFKSLNVPLRRMPDGRMFPADGKATTIVHALGDLLRDSETPILTNAAVTGIQPMKNGFIVGTKHFTLWAENVLLCTGGVSYPKLGSVGDGQNFAKALGHKLIPYQSGLIGLETSDPRITRLAGQRFEDGRAKVLSPDGKTTLFDYKGEVDCESFGLSGAAVYNAQRFIAHENLKDYIIEVWFAHERLQFKNLRPRPVKEAIVTIGGVDTAEIDPHTMESKIVPHLYFAGEVMNIDGPTGGYNLTLAFSTARKAVMSIAKTLAMMIVATLPFVMVGGNAFGAPNSAPKTVPQVKEWVGGEGTFKFDSERFLKVEKVKDSSLGTEGYKIDISKKGVVISATSKTGVFYAHQTLKQLLAQAPDKRIPCGKITDVPKYRVRGFVFDVGRLPVPIEFLYKVVDVMSYYKMNDLQLHLNDNYIWHADFAKQGKDPFKESYAAFRLESKIKGLTATDVNYKKADFEDLIAYAKKRGVNVIPEIDSPGHALALTRVRPDLIYQGPMSDPSKRCEMIDAAKPEALEFVCGIFDEYKKIFANCAAVHVGSDEFFGANEDYRKYLDGLLRHVKASGHTPRVWGSLRRKPGKTSVISEGVQMNIWSRDWGGAKESIALGYDIINTMDRDMYFVPTAGYYRMDRNLPNLWDNWVPNKVGDEWLEENDPHLLGAAWACWNDMIGPRHNGYTYKDLEPTIKEVSGVLSEKMWNGAKPPRSFDEHKAFLKTIER